jgi:hypothetical protein
MLELEVEIKDGGTEPEVAVEIKWPAGDAAPMSPAAEEVRGPASEHASRRGNRMNRPAWWPTLHNGR